VRLDIISSSSPARHTAVHTDEGLSPTAEEIRVWQIEQQDTLTEVKRSKLNREARIEQWLSNDIALLSPDLLVIGQQVPTAWGGFIDLLCLDANGKLVIVELKRDRTPREVTAQALDYSCAAALWRSA